MKTLLLCALIFMHNQSVNWEYLQAKGSILIFKNNKSYDTGLFDMKFIDILGNPSNPYFLVSGRTCTDCDENRSIYLLSLTDKAKSKDSLNRYQYPGTLRFYEDNTLLSNSKMIYGKCLKNNNRDFVIWLQNDRSDEGKFKKSLYIIEITDKGLYEKKIQRNNPDYQITINSLSKKYKELKGLVFTSEP